ncbi:MAG: DUF177 domain-containing protein [Rhodocyclaceae bacterium]
MSRPGHVIDSVRFARGGSVASGSIGLSRLARLTAQFGPQVGRAAFEVRGVEEEGKPLLCLTVSAQLSLRCQRCLDELVLPVSLRSRLLLIEAGEPWPEDEITEDRFDAIPAQVELDITTLIEDEMLLALPISPRHASCEAPAARLNGGEGRAFAGLANLLRPH